MEAFIKNIDQLIASKQLLNHPFYQAWSRGELSITCLQEYAKEYYQHVKAFPTYISALHSHTEESATRAVLLENLIEEEGGQPNHPALWRRFALGLGVKEEELDQHCPSSSMHRMITTFRALCKEASTIEGIGVLYAYESQIPAICHSKIAGLQEHYSMTNPEDWAYFTVHIDADEQHAADERALLLQYVTEANYGQLFASVNQTLDSLWNFLSSICSKYQISCSCFA